MTTFSYILIRSRRKSIAIIIHPTGVVHVRAPLRLPLDIIESTLRDKSSWISSKQHSASQRMMRRPDLPDLPSEPEIRSTFIREFDFWWRLCSIPYTKVRLSRARTRWGSCSSTGTISLNVQLARLPKNLLEYVVVHELAHRHEMNHSPAFWRIVATILPDYRQRRKELAQYSWVLHGLRRGDPDS